MSITVYSKPNCVQCNATYRALKKEGFGSADDGSFDIVDLTENLDALASLKEKGFTSVPVVIARDENGIVIEEWAGFQPDKISKLPKQ